MLLRVRDQIDCALLFDQPCARFGGELVAQVLGQVMPEAGFELRSEEEGKFMVLVAEARQLFLVISLNSEPLGPQGFRNALSSPFRQMTFPLLDEAVERHTSNVFITVSNSSPVLHMLDTLPADIAQQLKAMTGGPAEEAPAAAVEEKIAVCYLVARFLAKALQPTAIHWCQSDQLVSLDYFTSQPQSGFPAPLHLHPMLYEAGSTPEGKTLVGFKTLGARHIVGREIHFKECAADLPWMYLRALNLLQMARMNGHELVPDGESFGANEDEVIRVRHLPAGEDTVAMIELTVEKSLEHGIGTAPPPQPAYFGYDFSSPRRAVFGRRKPS